MDDFLSNQLFDDCTNDEPKRKQSSSEGLETDQGLEWYKVKLTIRKVMKIYWKMVEIAAELNDIPGKMVGGGIRQLPNGSGNPSKMADMIVSKQDAEKYVEMIDDIVLNQLTGLNRLIINAKYIEEIESIDEIYQMVRNYFKIPKGSKKYSKRTYYRHQKKAEIAFYKKILQNSIKI